MGTNDSGLPNGANGSFTTRNEAGTGGAETHTLVTGELATHNHDFNIADVGSSKTRVGEGSATDVTLFGQMTNAGSNTPHANVQPFLVLNYIIKT